MTVDKSGRRIQSMFGEISGQYDFMNHALSFGVDYSWRRKAVRAVAADTPGPILDVCTGTGDLAIAFWKRYRGRVEVVGTDFTHEMLAIAADKRERKGIPAERDEQQPLSFLEADTQSLPFEDDTFAAVSVAFGLRNVTDTRQGIREMMRVCRPGGQVLILEFGMPRNRVFGGMYRWYFKRVLPKLGQLFARNRQAAYHYLPASVSEFPHGPELVALLEECGLEKVTWKSLTLGVAGLYVGVKPAVAEEKPASDDQYTGELKVHG